DRYAAGIVSLDIARLENLRGRRAESLGDGHAVFHVHDCVLVAENPEIRLVGIGLTDVVNPAVAADQQRRIHHARLELDIAPAHIEARAGQKRYLPAEGDPAAGQVGVEADGPAGGQQLSDILADQANESAGIRDRRADPGRAVAARSGLANVDVERLP